jgi:hypothetical protein
MNARVAHQARLIQTKITRKQTRPHGNYSHSEHQWGVVHAVNQGGTQTVDLFLDGAQNTGNPANITPSVKHLASYVPTEGDVVLVYRGAGRSRSSRVVLGKLNGAASPYPLPLGSVDTQGRFTSGPNAQWGGPGVPPVTLGITGDWYMRTDTPGISMQMLYVKTASGWTPVL